MMHQAYQQDGLDSTLIEVSGAQHSFIRPFRMSPSPAQIEQMTIEFFTEHLVNAK